jgi:hypothetical protein
LVQVIPYGHRQINESEFPAFIRKMTGLDLAAFADDHLSSDAQAIMGDFRYGQPRLDKARRRFITDLNGHVVGIGTVRGRIVGYFGRDSLVQVMFYAPESEWNEHLPIGSSIIDSFRFDAAKAYSMAEARASAPDEDDMSRIVGRGIGGAITAGVIALLVGAAGRGKKQPRKLSNRSASLIVIIAVLVFVGLGVMAAIR